jgi:hypothetical protein
MESPTVPSGPREILPFGYALSIRRTGIALLLFREDLFGQKSQNSLDAGITHQRDEVGLSRN